MFFHIGVVDDLYTFLKRKSGEHSNLIQSNNTFKHSENIKIILFNIQHHGRKHEQIFKSIGIANLFTQHGHNKSYIIDDIIQSFLNHVFIFLVLSILHHLVKKMNEMIEYAFRNFLYSICMVLSLEAVSTKCQ